MTAAGLAWLTDAMASERHTAGLDVIAATEAILRFDDEGLAAILVHANLRAMAEVGCTVLAVVLGGAAPDPDAVLGRMRQHFSQA